MNRIVRVLAVSLVCLCTLGYSPIGLSSDCVKLVFNRFCLGGPSESLPAVEPLPERSQETEYFQVLGSDKYLEVGVVNDQISLLTRYEQPGDWLNFTDWRSKLIRLYGQPEDLSSFPAYASSRSSRLNAINAGRGYAHVRWQQPGFSIALVWNHRDHIELRYQLDAAAIPSSNDEGL